MGLISKALAGAAGAVKETSFELMRAEILALRDARLNEYARTMKTEIDHPFARAERAAGETFQAGEKQKDRQFSRQIADERNKTSVDVAKVQADSRMTAAETRAAVAGKDKGRLTQKDGIIHVLQPRYGGRLDGGVWFPDEGNRDVALRAMQIYEQLTSDHKGLSPIAAATQAAQQAEREHAMGTLPIGRAPTPGAEKPKRDFRPLWGNRQAEEDAFIEGFYDSGP